MSRYTKRVEALSLLVAVLLCASCFLVDLREATCSVLPSEPWSVLESVDARVGVNFDFDVERLDAERAFSVRSSDGAVQGDYSWDGRTMTWKATSPLVPRVRYRLLFRGTVRASDGRACIADSDVPFWVLSAGEPARLLEVWPPDGFSQYASQEGQCVLEARFSEAMEPLSVKHAFSCTPELDVDWVWNESFDVLRLLARSNLTPCQTYRWSLSAEAKATDASPLASAASGRFFTDADATPPTVLYARPVREIGGRWQQVADSLSGLDVGDAVGLWFSEPMDPESFQGNIRMDPEPRLSIVHADPAFAVLLPDKPWPTETTLCLMVEPELEDVSGLRLSKEWKETFTSSVRCLQLVSLESGDGESLAQPEDGALLAITVGPEPEGIARLILKFSDVFDAAGMAMVPDMLRLSVLFPSSVPTPSLRSISWDGNDTLSVEWEGFRRSSAQSDVFYRLSLKGALAGPVSINGLRLKKDIVLYLEAKP